MGSARGNGFMTGGRGGIGAALVDDDGYVLYRTGEAAFGQERFGRELGTVPTASLGDDGSLLFFGDLHGHDRHLLFHDRSTGRTLPVVPRPPFSLSDVAPVIGAGDDDTFWVVDSVGTQAFQWRPSDEILQSLRLPRDLGGSAVDVAQRGDLLLLLMEEEERLSLVAVNLAEETIVAIEELSGRLPAALHGMGVAVTDVNGMYRSFSLDLLNGD
jgi:hypothetical protein